MVSRRPPNPVEKANPAWMLRPNSPLENTPHKAGNGDDPHYLPDRHCPKCQGEARLKWLDQRKAELLPTPYFHLVFTLPETIAALALQNQKAVYEILFVALLRRCSPSRPMPNTWALNPPSSVYSNLGPEPDSHATCIGVVTGGGLAPRQPQWISGRRRFFLPLRVLGRLFRRFFVDALHKGGLRPTSVCWTPVRHRVSRPYVNRVAISNRRLRTLQHGQVTFEYKDCRDGNSKPSVWIPILRPFAGSCTWTPARFQRIRYYGLLANCHGARRLELCRQLLTTGVSAPLPNLRQCQQLKRSLRESLRHRQWQTLESLRVDSS